MDFSVHPPTSMAFELMGTSHLVSLAVVLAINLSFIPLRRVQWEPWRRAFRYGLAVMLAASELVYDAWRLHVGLWNVRENIAILHLCGLMIWVAAVVLVTRRQQLYELVYFLGIGGAGQTLLTPDLIEYGFPHIRFFTCIVSHAAIVTAAVYLTVVEGMRPTWRSIWRVSVFMLSYMAVVGVLNQLLGSNYLFISHKPETPSLIDVLGPWPWYILSLIGVGLATVLLLYLPFAVMDWRRRSVRPEGAVAG